MPCEEDLYRAMEMVNERKRFIGNQSIPHVMLQVGSVHNINFSLAIVTLHGVGETSP